MDYEGLLLSLPIFESKCRDLSAFHARKLQSKPEESHQKHLGTPREFRNACALAQSYWACSKHAFFFLRSGIDGRKFISLYENVHVVGLQRKEELTMVDNTGNFKNVIVQWKNQVEAER
jgi:hypothetical protein